MPHYHSTLAKINNEILTKPTHPQKKKQLPVALTPNLSFPYLDRWTAQNFVASRGSPLVA